MCGICGILQFDGRSNVTREQLAEMNRQLTHRGPDDDGFYVAGNVGLAMRRLSIIDLQTGHQPISNEDGTIWVVCNGEIYNHKELRRNLIPLGHQYSTHSDVESIVHLYEEYGTDCVQHLQGMFAFALWDQRKRTFLAARDRLGIKPFYYFHDDRKFLFGSEIKALLAYPGVVARLNEDVLPEYLAFGYVSLPATMFVGIQKLPPGHTLQSDESGELKIAQYWDLKQGGGEHETRPKSFYVNGYRDLLEGAVASHLMSDVPLGVFLSGGLDSSAIAALMTKLNPGPIQTFSVGYDDDACSELPYARTVAEHLKSEHHEVLLSSQEFFDSLPTLIWHEDEPIAWPSSVALYFLAKLARERVTVVLTGEGSDETLAGYARYALTSWNTRADRIYRTLTPAALRSLVRSAIQSERLGAVMRRKLEHTFLGRDSQSWASFYFDNFYSAFSATEQSSLLSSRLRQKSLLAYAGSAAFWEHSSGDLIHRMLYTDIKTYLVELLMKQDNMSMAASIESRVPFLDHVLVEFATKIPAHLQVKGLTGKSILKEIAKDLLPESIIYRRKAGFPTPWSRWATGERLNQIEQMLMAPRSLDRDLFEPAALRRIFAEHRSRARDNTDRIWRLLNLELWHQVFIDRDKPPRGLDERTVAEDKIAG